MFRPVKRSPSTPASRAGRPQPTRPTPARGDGRTKLLDAALGVIRARGYGATRVEDICAAAGVSKGAFFHHFASKEALAIAAAHHWSDVTGALFASAPYRSLPDPLDRVLAYVALRRELLRGRLPEFTCLAGTMVQEVFETAPAVRDACAASITGHAGTLVVDIEAARAKYAPDADWSAESLALHTQAVLQGAFILAKATDGPKLAEESVDHLDRYLRLLFRRP
ncbi:MAG: TetR/AcrR family transcriptional regulator [Candidatus Eisenbacteria bacterium]